MKSTSATPSLIEFAVTPFPSVLSTGAFLPGVVVCVTAFAPETPDPHALSADAASTRTTATMLRGR